MNTIVAFGNPLLDTIVTLQDDVILKKYNLKIDGQKVITEGEMKCILTDISRYEQTISPGGCAQNSLRVLQWMLRRKCCATIYGSAGRDRNGKILKELMLKDGVQTRYVEHEQQITGTTVALVNGVNRSLVAHLGAAELLSPHHLTDIIPQLENADLIYMEGFFLTKRAEVARFILSNCSKLKKTFAFNISGQYMCDLDPDAIRHFSEEADILFGNRQEFHSLCSIRKNKDIRELIKDLFTQKKTKTIVITNGSQPVLCAHDNGKMEEMKVSSSDPSEIVDTTGAGDAFVGGFLAGFILKRTPLNCCELGCYAAQEIIKNKGCTLPNHQPQVLL